MNALGIPPTTISLPDEYEQEQLVYAYRGCIGPILWGLLRGFAISGDGLQSPAHIEIVARARSPVQLSQTGHLVWWSSIVAPGQTMNADTANRFIADDDDFLFWRLTDWRERRERGESIVVNIRLELPTEDPLIAVARRAVDETRNSDRYDEALHRLLAREERA